MLWRVPDGLRPQWVNATASANDTPERATRTVERAQIRQLCALRQLDRVAVEVPIPSGPTPRLRLRFVQNLGACLCCTAMGFGQIGHLKRYLDSRCRCSALRLVEREMNERAVSPRGCSMSPTGPPINPVVIAEVKVESEPVLVQGHRTIEIRHFENDCDETIQVR